MNTYVEKLGQQPRVAQQYMVLLFRVEQFKRAQRWSEALINMARLKLLIRDMQL